MQLGACQPLPEPAVQYADYAAWQERWLRGAEADRQRAYWRARLADVPPPVELGSQREAVGWAGTAGFALQLPPGAIDPAAGLGLAAAEIRRRCPSTIVVSESLAPSRTISASSPSARNAPCNPIATSSKAWLCR